MRTYFCLPPGGRGTAIAVEGARGIIIYRSPQTECFAFVHAGFFSPLSPATFDSLPLGGSPMLVIASYAI